MPCISAFSRARSRTRTTFSRRPRRFSQGFSHAPWPSGSGRPAPTPSNHTRTLPQSTGPSSMPRATSPILCPPSRAQTTPARSTLRSRKRPPSTRPSRSKPSRT
eukprot:Amastigsp_a174975_535.p3 type:complete len:104 gc:universal Amastigsp_a174975_535:770-1081(+)